MELHIQKPIATSAASSFIDPIKDFANFLDFTGLLFKLSLQVDQARTHYALA